MNIRLRSLITHSTSSTKLVAEFLESALKSKVDSESLRNTYQSHFQELLSLENTPINFDDIKHVLQLFQDSFVTDENQTILEYLKQSRFKEATLVTIHGTGKPAVLDFGIAAEKWVLDGIAEPGIIEVLARKQTPSSTLLALAAGAECAPTKAWLAAGGTVVAVMRENPRRWMELIEFARQSAGTLIVPLKTKPVSDVKDHELSNLAGIDLVKDVEFLPSILSQSVRENHTVVGAYAYSPGSTHLIVQAVQDAIVEYATTHFMPHQVGFHWLATPTDSQLLPRKFQEHAMSRYQQRGFQVKMRDAIWRIFGQLKKPNHREQENLVIVDSSVKKQGFNYQIAKRTQRLRAHLLHHQGFKVAYSVTPPATTDSVLEHRILIASYRGAPRYGLNPFDKDLIGPLAMQQCLHSLSHEFKEPYEIYSNCAVHGGLWRLGYDPKTVWIPATISGLLALLLPKNRAFRSVSFSKR